MQVRGVVHCHSDLSFDCESTLRGIRDALLAKRFHFVALTEHTKDVSASAYHEYVLTCDAMSDESFVMLPGLEIRCTDSRHELLAIGLRQYLKDDDSMGLIKSIKQHGAFCVLPHPWKHGQSKFIEGVDGIELLNGKVDGLRAPNFALTRFFYRESNVKLRPCAIFGADAHSLDSIGAVFVECELKSLSPGNILESLKCGDFLNSTVFVSVPATGRMTLIQQCRCCLWRSAYIGWNWFLRLASHLGLMGIVQSIRKRDAPVNNSRSARSNA